MNSIAPRRGSNGVAYRHVVNGRTRTLFGLGVRQCVCLKCQKIKNESEFYHSTETNGFKKVWSVCVECDDKRRLLDAKIKRRRDKGIYVDKNLQPIATLERFLE
jgi:RNase P subunit RPR2